MKSYDPREIRYCEEHGIIERTRNGDWLEYWSFFPGEGFRFVQVNLATGAEYRDGLIPWDPTEGRPMPEFLRGIQGGLYNYCCG